MFLGALEAVGHFARLGAAAPVRHVVISEGDPGIYQTVKLIKQKVAEGIREPAVVNQVRSILGGLLASASQTEKAKALVAWVVANIRYQHDDDMSWTEAGLQWINIQQCPRRFKQCEAVEMVSDAPQILAERKGDCDDMVLLLGAFFSLAGISWCPVIVALDPVQPREYSHIYLVANLDGSYVPVDAVNRNQPFGWEAEGAFRREVLC